MIYAHAVSPAWRAGLGLVFAGWVAFIAVVIRRRLSLGRYPADKVRLEKLYMYGCWVLCALIVVAVGVAAVHPSPK